MSIFRRSKPKTDENAEVDERMAPTPTGQLPEPVSVLDPKALSEIIDRLRDLGEIVSSVGDYRKKLDRESEAVSNFVQELGEYVEKVSSRRSKLEEDARKLNELCDKLEQETTEVSALRSQIEEKVSRIHESLDRYQSE